MLMNVLCTRARYFPLPGTQGRGSAGSHRKCWHGTHSLCNTCNTSKCYSFTKESNVFSRAGSNLAITGQIYTLPASKHPSFAKESFSLQSTKSTLHPVCTFAKHARVFTLLNVHFVVQMDLHSATVCLIVKYNLGRE